jgi:peptidyl-prolyl cis-trans isomerase D
MLSFLRRLTNSKIGLFITFAALILISLAFAAGDLIQYTGGGGSLPKTTVAEIGKTRLTEDGVKTAVQDALNNYRRQNPDLTMAQFVAGGGFEATLQRLIDGVALQQFGEAQGMFVSKKAVDGAIASAPGLQGVNGKFDPNLYQQVLAQQHLTDAMIRADIRQGLFSQMLTAPIVSADYVPRQVALPYASLLLEQRSGEIGFISAKAMNTGAAPTDKELAAYYKQHIDHYTLPERRVIGYAIVTPDKVAAQAKPTDAEIAQAYKAQAARFQPTEKRTLDQVIIADKKAADALAAKVRAGTSLDAAAKAAGLEAATIADVTKAEFADRGSADVANAAFAAKAGDLVGPVKGPLGWAVIRVVKVTQVPGKTLAQAHDELAQQIVKEKTNDLLGKLHDAMDDAITGGASFEDVVSDNKLTAEETPAVTQQGVDPTNPASQPDPRLAPVVQSGFDAQQGDSPELVPVGQDGAFAIATPRKVVASAPQPIAAVHDRVVKDLLADRAEKEAHDKAAAILAKVNKGMTMRQAFSEAGVPAAAVQSVHATRAELAASPQGAPPPLALMFSTPAKQAKLLEAPNNGGWLVVYTDTIVHGDASKRDDVVKATRSGLSRFVGTEYADQFARAVRAVVGVKKNEAAIAKLRADLAGTGADAQP